MTGTGDRGISPSLGSVAARGGAILGIASAAERGAQFLRAIILAKLLTPHDFGLMGMALVVVFTAEALSQTGLNRAIVQKRGDPTGDLSTVWILSALRGLSLFAISWLLAPWVAMAFETPEVTDVLRWTALVFPIQALVNPAFFLLERELAFVSVAWPRLMGICFDLVVAVAASVVLRNVWGMVCGFLAGKIVYIASSYVARPWRPSLRFQWDRALALYRYGRHVFRAAVVDCLVNQGDRALIGRVAGPESLGIYSLAARLASLPSTAGVQIVFRVAFPVFAQVQDDPTRLRNGFRRALELFAALIVPVCVGFWVTAEHLVPVLFSPKWIEMIPPFQVLSIAGAPMALYQLLRVVVSAIGRPDTAARASYLYLGLFAVPLYPAVMAWGAVGAAWCALVAGTLGMLFLFTSSLRLTGTPASHAVRAVTPAVAGGALMAGVLLLGQEALGFAPSAAWLATQVVAGAAIYLSTVAVADRMLGTSLAATLQPLLSAVGRRGPGSARSSQDPDRG